MRPQTWTQLARTAAAFLGLCVLVSCGGGSDRDSSAEGSRESALSSGERALSPDTPCTNCVFGPTTLVRASGQPDSTSFAIAGDPIADYVIDINDNGSKGADASVTLDNVVVLAPLADGQSGPRHVAINVKLKTQSSLVARLTGKVGSTLTVAIRAGAKRMGVEGGTVTSAGSAVSLTVPPGALTTATEVSISPPATQPPLGAMPGSAFDLGPSGTTFALPVTLTVKYDPLLVPPDWAQTSLTLAVADNATWVDLSTSVDTAIHSLTAQLSHFSTYAYKVRDPNVMTNPMHIWHGVNGCWTSEDAAYNGRLAELAKRIFKLSSSPTTGLGCVTEPYLADGYSFYWPSNENHAGIDFRSQVDGVAAYAIADGVVDYEILDLKSTPQHSTLTLRSTVGGRTYRLLYLHCKSHDQIRNSVNLEQLKIGTAVQAGDQVCGTGSVGAGSSHLHFEVKALGMDANSPSAISGGQNHCQTLSFYGYDSINKTFSKLTSPGCSLDYIGSNSVDPTVLLEAPPSRRSARSTIRAPHSLSCGALTVLASRSAPPSSRARPLDSSTPTAASAPCRRPSLPMASRLPASAKAASSSASGAPPATASQQG